MSKREMQQKSEQIKKVFLSIKTLEKKFLRKIREEAELQDRKKQK